jgi:predicted GIY-YIG superfamily endonuclease
MSLAGSKRAPSPRKRGSGTKQQADGKSNPSRFDTLLEQLEKEPLSDDDAGYTSDLNDDLDDEASNDINDDDEEDVDEKEEKKEQGGGDFWVYVLESWSNSHYSYVGYTVDRARRLRQHNGELISNGAKYTKQHRPWRMIMSMRGNGSWWTKKVALQLEWRIKHVSKGRTKIRRGKPLKKGARWKTLRCVDRPAVERRINDIFWLFHNRRKWTSNAPEWSTDKSIQIELHPSLITKEITDFANQCTYWKPTIATLAHPPPPPSI